MPSIVTCPGCGQSFRAQDHLAGRTVNCPGCRNLLTVPVAQPQYFPPVTQTPVVPSYPAMTPRPKQSSMSASDRKFLFVSIAIASPVVVVLLSAMVGYQWWKNRRVDVATHTSSADVPPAANNSTPASQPMSEVATAAAVASQPTNPVVEQKTISPQPPKKPVVKTGASPDDQVVEIPVGWSVGEKVQYRMTKGRHKKSSRGLQKGESTIDLGIDVLEANDKGCVLLWNYGGGPTNPMVESQDRVVYQIGSVMPSFQAKIRIDREGAITGVDNWQELQQAARNMLEDSFRRMPQSADNAQQQAHARQVAESLFSTEAQVTHLFTQDAQIFLSVLGKSYSSTPTTYESELSNAIGTTPLAGTLTLQLKKLNQSTNEAVISWDQRLDPDAARQFINEVVNKLGGADAETEAELKGFSMENSAEFVIDLSSVWPKEMKYSRISKSASFYQEETLRLMRK